MGELARGSVGDRPWGRTLAALGLRGVSGQLALVADGKRFLIGLEHGAVVAAASPLTSDAAVRVALTGHLVSSSQVPEISRRQALAPERDEIDVIAELARLGPDHALRLRRRVIAQRAARTFSIPQGEFAVTDHSELVVLDGCQLDVRAVIYMGARANLSEHRLRTELDQLGSWFRLKPDLDDDLPQFGFGDAEQPVIERLRDGGTIEDLEEFASSFIDSRTVRAVVYSLASYNACDHGPPRPRRVDEAAHALTRELPRVSVSGTAATQPISTLPIPTGRPGTPVRGMAPISPSARPAPARGSDLSELTPISIARITPVSELTPTSIPRQTTRPATEGTPISMPRQTRPTPTSVPRQARPGTEPTPISVTERSRAARPTPMPEATRLPSRAARPTPEPGGARPATAPPTRPLPTATRAPSAPVRHATARGEDAHGAQGVMFDAPTQRDSAAFGSDPGLRPPYDVPAPREASSPALRPPAPGRPQHGSDPALRRPDSLAGSPRDTGLQRADALRRAQDGHSSSVGLVVPPDNLDDDADLALRRVPDAAPRGRSGAAAPDARPQPGSDPALRRPVDGLASSASLRLPTEAQLRGGEPGHASSASLRLPTEAQLRGGEPGHASSASLRLPTEAQLRGGEPGHASSLRAPAEARPQPGSDPALRRPPSRDGRDRSSVGLPLPLDAGNHELELALPAEPAPRARDAPRSDLALRRPPDDDPAPEPMILRVPSARPPARARQVASTDSPQSHDVKALIAQRLKLLDQGGDHFQLLGVAQDAAGDALRRSYFALARQLHPDRLAALGISDDGKHAQRLFAQINAGFAVLSDPARRDHYVSVLRRGGEAAIRADEARAEELARRVLDAEEAFRRGEMALRRDQPQAAVTELAAAVQLNPEEADYHALLAWAQFCAAPDKMAVAAATRGQLDKAIQRSPHAVTGRFYLGRVERMLGRDQDAARYFREVLAAAPGHTEAASELRVLEARLAGDKPSGGGLFGRKR